MNQKQRTIVITDAELRQAIKEIQQAEANAHECPQCAAWQAAFDSVIEQWYAERGYVAKELRLAIEGHDFSGAIKYQAIEETIDRILNILLEERVKVTRGDSD